MQTDTQDRTATLAVLCGALLLSLDGLLFRLIEADAWQALFWRMASFAFVIGAFLTYRYGLRDFGSQALLGLSGILVAILLAGVNILFVLAITSTTVANTLILFSTVPLFGAAFGWLLLRQPIARRTAVTVATCFTAVVAVFVDQMRVGSAWGDLSALAAAGLFAGYLAVVRSYPSQSFLTGLVLAGTLASFAGYAMSDPFALDSKDIWLLVVSGALQQTLALLLIQSGARVLSPAEVGLLALAETIAGPVWAWLAVGELPSIIAILAGGVIIVAVGAHAYFSLESPIDRQPRASDS